MSTAVLQRPAILVSQCAKAMGRRDRLADVIAAERRVANTLQQFIDKGRECSSAIQVKGLVVADLRVHLDEFVALTEEIREMERAIGSRRRGHLTLACYAM